MQVVGFGFAKILAEKSSDFKRCPPPNIDIEFTGQEKEKTELLKEAEVIKIIFKFTVSYMSPDKKDQKQGQVAFEGTIHVSAGEEESKEFAKLWKKKEIPKQFLTPLYNFILKRCSIKALQLEEDLVLPFHMPLPQVKLQQKE